MLDRLGEATAAPYVPHLLQRHGPGRSHANTAYFLAVMVEIGHYTKCANHRKVENVATASRCSDSDLGVWGC